LNPDKPVAMGSFDAHYGAVGAGVKTGTLVKIIGTSTCDCAIASAKEPLKDVPGICGIVNGSIMPGYYGIEAGQSAVGDILHWWVDVVCRGRALHARCRRRRTWRGVGPPGADNNGNRTILVDPRLTGILVGQTLHTTRAEVYRALIEATAYGARAIIERMREYGVPIDRVVCCGGIAEKNPLFMQIYADVIGHPMLIAGSPQTPALGAAIAAAVVAGAHASFEAAQEKMTRSGTRYPGPRGGARLRRALRDLPRAARQLRRRGGGEGRLPHPHEAPARDPRARDGAVGAIAWPGWRRRCGRRSTARTSRSPGAAS
jgi:L-ribulokinase